MLQFFHWLFGQWLAPGLTNTQSTFAADVSNYIADKTLPRAIRQLVAYQFGDALRLPANSGLTYTASRFERLPLPFAQLQEGVAPAGVGMSLSQVSATVQQWGDRGTITDVANLTIKHPVFQQLINLISMQMPETLERNTFTTLQAATQVNFANAKASRAALVATDIINPMEVYRITGSLETYGAPRFMGDEREDMKIDADSGVEKGSRSPSVMPHYVALIHPLPARDMMSHSTVATAWAQSDVNRLYNSDIGSWGGVHFCQSNMVPYWTGAAEVAGTAVASGGTLTAGNYRTQVTAMRIQDSVERIIYQPNAANIVVAANGAISVTTPTLPGYVFNIYISLAGVTTPVNLGACALGPTSGPLAGQATQLPSGTTCIITGIGAAQVPPAAPATGITVYPTYFLGRNAYGQVVLEAPEFHYLRDADKSDPLNQTRVVAWKVFYGSILLNQAFMARLESGSGFTSGYTSGTQS